MGGSTDLIFYKQRKNDWVSEYLTNKTDEFALNDITVYSNYYEKNTVSLYFTMNKEPRVRVSVNTFLQANHGVNKIDAIKTTAALYVNAVHALDASYLRSIAFYTRSKNIPIITIHDGFCVPFFTETTLRSIANCMFFENITPNQYLANNQWQPDSTTILV